MFLIALSFVLHTNNTSNLQGCSIPSKPCGFQNAQEMFNLTVACNMWSLISSVFLLQNFSITSQYIPLFYHIGIKYFKSFNKLYSIYITSIIGIKLFLLILLWVSKIKTVCIYMFWLIKVMIFNFHAIRWHHFSNICTILFINHLALLLN